MKNLCLTLGLLLACVAPAFARQDPKPTRDLSADGLALSGFDPVAYFPAGGAAPKAGNPKFELSLAGTRYRFESAEHLAWFQAEPARYAPAFGGFDASAMASGERRSAVAQHFRVEHARLFLFAQADDIAGFDAAAQVRADTAWKSQSGESPRGIRIDDSGTGTPWNLGKQQLAIEGFDPVGYFPEGGAARLRGDPKIETVLGGARYRFASEAHRTWFLAEPERYRPKYGGWCAYAMADGDEVEVDTNSFLIENGRLLLFYKGFLADTRAKWLPKAAQLAVKADANWAKRKPK